MKDSRIPVVALVGRTNVGKSSLFNRLLEENKALVSDIAGTTRDRLEGTCIWRGQAIKIVDTGGLDVDQRDEIERNTVRQAKLAVKAADLVILVADAKQGPLPQETELARELKRSGKPAIIAANKAETPSERHSVEENAWRLGGLPAPFPISALRGTGVGDLLDAVYVGLKKAGVEPVPMSQVKPVRVAVIGRPNVGKSSLLNTIFGEERFIATPVAGTTREPNDVLLEVGERSYLFIDTAGLRKMAKVKRTGGLERAGVERTKKVIDSADVVLFVMDASERIGMQERVLAGMIKDAACGLIIVANKWDLIPDKTPGTMTQYRKNIALSIPFISWAPVEFVSASTHQRVEKLFDVIDGVQQRRHEILPERELDSFWRAAVTRHLPSKGKGPAPPKVLGLTQIETGPPTFQLTIKAKRLDVLHPSYLRFLENQMRGRFDLTGTPVRIIVKGATSVSNTL
jgi:GTP-binding protein